MYIYFIKNNKDLALVMFITLFLFVCETSQMEMKTV